MLELADPSSKLVLVVDDDEGSLDLLEQVAKREGFRVERAVDGSEALRKAQELKPDAIVLDFMLPGVGGIEVVKELQSGDARRTPVLIVTGRKIDRGSVGMVRNEPNVREFLEKPIKPAYLAGLLHRLLETKPSEIRRVPERGPLSSRW